MPQRVKNSIDSHAYIKAFEKIGQMPSSHCEIICFIAVVTSIAMERFCHKEPSPGTYD
jgi:acid phosphatase family membrane protein YuiD